MTTAATPTPTPGPGPAPLRRDPARGLLAGVCAGVGERLGVDPMIVRLVVVALTFAGGIGPVLYLLAWIVLPAGPAGAPAAERLRTRPGTWRVAAGVGLLALGALLAFRELGLWFSDAIAWPLVLAAAGAALVWRQSARQRATEAAPTADPPLPGQVEAASREAAVGVYRGGFGVALIVGAALLFLYANGALSGLGEMVLTAVVVVVAAGLILAPFWWGLATNLAAERAERIRSQERAELGAHLHDSVLQTLALVQKRADDPRAVARLARRQERELRAWLQSGRPAPAPDASLAAGLQAAAAEVEDAHGVPIEVVAVGDAPLDDDTRAVVDAAREALVNAAKFAGEDAPVAVYAEVTDGRVQVFVRDRGAGFDPAAVPPDRRGLRESVVGRMERHGGRAVVHAAPGAGTEVELTLERTP